MNLSKFSDEDLQALKGGDLKSMSTEGLQELKRQQAPASVAEQNLASLEGKGPLDDLMSMSHDIGQDVKAGIGGIADLVSGNGLQTSASNVGKIEDDKDATTTAANVGAGIGAQFTPNQIAMMAAFGKVGDIVGPWVGSLLKGWAGDAAIAAVGKIKSIGKALGLTNLDALGKFLLTPIKIGEEEFEPIVSATSSPQQMLDAAKAIRDAAGKQLGNVSKTVDSAINGVSEANGARMDVGSSLLDMNALGKNIQALKEEAVGDLPNLGKKVATQFDDAVADLEAFAKKQADGDTATAFSDLSSIKTKIGNLVYKHGSPLESKAALNDVYHAISDALDKAAKNVGGEHGAAYDLANQTYHQAFAICEGLEGKAVDARNLFGGGAIGALAATSGLVTALTTHNPLLAAVATATPILGKFAGQMADNYAPQMIARGLEKGAPLVTGALKIGARGIPVVGNALFSVLHTGDQDQ